MAEENSTDLDSEFALFEQEISALEQEEGEATELDTSATEHGEHSAGSSVQAKDLETNKGQDRITGVKRPVQSVYSSAPVSSSAQEQSSYQVTAF